MYFISLIFSSYFILSIGVTIVSPLNNTTVREGNTTTITCEAIGYTGPVVWSRTNGTLSDRVSVSDNVSVPTGDGNVTRVSVNLTITNASREDTGVYVCSANNSVGSGNKNINITVQCEFIIATYINFIKPCMCWSHAPGFLKLLCLRSQYVCVCPTIRL